VTETVVHGRNPEQSTMGAVLGQERLMPIVSTVQKTVKNLWRNISFQVMRLKGLENLLSLDGSDEGRVRCEEFKTCRRRVSFKRKRCLGGFSGTRLLGALGAFAESLLVLFSVFLCWLATLRGMGVLVL
jgi:hypothetical protein